MTEAEAIKNLEDIKRMYTWSTGADDALDMAIEALKNQAGAREMLEDEKRHEPLLCREYHDGRISAFYDALGIDYSD